MNALNKDDFLVPQEAEDTLGAEVIEGLSHSVNEIVPEPLHR